MLTRRYRCGIGGIAIESCTFSSHLSTIDDFTILRGPEMQPRYPFLPDWRFRDRKDVQWLPCLYARAIPGGPIRAQDYAALKGELLERVRAALPLDGFYFDVHGAMFVEGMEDAESDLAAALRDVVGPACVVATGQDLHGNVSARLVELIDVFTAYRLAPHDDELETRERTCALLVKCLDEGLRPWRAWTRIPVILPGERTSTSVEPGKTVYGRLVESDGVPGALDASLWVGYVWADEPRTGASVVVTGTDPDAIGREAEKIARRYWEARRAFEFVAPAGTAAWCLERAAALADAGERAIFISDSGDNPTAGGVGDIPYFLGRLLKHPQFARGAATAIYASMLDPAAVEACAGAGSGQQVHFWLGGRRDPQYGVPLEVRGTVTALLRDDPVGGDIAVIRSGGVSVIVTTRRKPYLLVRDLQAVGLDPEEHHVTVVKLGYLFPDLRRVARHALMALTPGLVDQDIAQLPFRRVPRPVFPLDPAMEWEPAISLFGGPGQPGPVSPGSPAHAGTHYQHH
jgi:microcystin degradation protein MlrC